MYRTRYSWTIAGFVLIVLGYNCIVAWNESTNPEFAAVLYLGLAAFVGSYSSLGGQPEQPSPEMAIGLIAALLVTFGAALSLLLRLSRTGIARIATERRKGGIVVIGSSVEADSISRSITGESRKSFIRIREDGPYGELGTVPVPNWRNITDDPLARRSIQAASSIIVASSSDSATARISTAIRELSARTRLFHLVRSSALARALRPDVLLQIPDSEGFHPSDTLGQLVASSVLNQSHASDSALRIVLKADSHEPTAVGVREWLYNTMTATSFVDNRHTRNIEIVRQDADVNLCVIAGEPEVVAAQTAKETGQRAVIAVVSPDLLGSVSLARNLKLTKFSDWAGTEPLAEGEILTIDPDRDGLHYQAVTNGLAAQWGRAFHDAYASLYLAANPEATHSPWVSEGERRENQSSIAAAKYMLVVLREFGYELRTSVESGWGCDAPSAEELDLMARMEHNEWWTRRTWQDADGSIRRVSLRKCSDGTWQNGPNCVPFDDLDTATQIYNRDVIERVYPALAAMFGYGIRKTQSKTFS